MLRNLSGNPTNQAQLIFLPTLRVSIWCLIALVKLTTAILVLGLATSLCSSASNGDNVPVRADGIIVEKALRTMKLMSNGKVLKTYKVALSTAPIGPKQREGDHRVPEGKYIVDAKNSHSRFHLALHISYPNESDRQKARKLGVRPGGDIEIRGLGKYGLVGSLHRQVDWTDGCVAVTNSEIDEIWPLVAVGTPVEIRP